MQRKQEDRIEKEYRKLVLEFFFLKEKQAVRKRI